MCSFFSYSAARIIESPWTKESPHQCIFSFYFQVKDKRIRRYLSPKDFFQGDFVKIAKTKSKTPPVPRKSSGNRMGSSQKYSLKWNDFTSNVAYTFRDLHSRHDFVDVTLACSDGSTLEAHKVILSSVSSYFKDILKVRLFPEKKRLINNKMI